MDQIIRKRRKPIMPSFRPSGFEHNVSAFNISKVL
jgi:hypothetical protein